MKDYTKIFFTIFVYFNLFIPLFNSFVVLPEDDDLYEGSACQNSEENGLCTKKSDCPQAKKDVEQYGYHNLTHCGFVGVTEIVCCPLAQSRVKGDKAFKNASKKACDDLIKNFSTTVSPQIAKGKDANPGEFPYVAALGFYNSENKAYDFKCAGSLISNKYVVTAAHCFYSQDELKIVRLGVTIISENDNQFNPVTDYNIKNSIKYPKYINRKPYYDDIGLIELEKELEFSENVYPTCLYTTKDIFPEELIISGWGFVNSSTKATVLQKAAVSSTNFQQCKERYQRAYRYTLFEGQVCAEDPESDTCEGDSGGPLQRQNTSFPFLVGITSFGPPSECEASSVPSVYTSISHYVEWIESIVWT